MSGGRFEYKQYAISSIADDIENYIEMNSVELVGRDNSKETLDKFKEAVNLLRKASVAVQRIDWLLSDDDGEETFHLRWKKDMDKLNDALLS